MTLLLNSSNRLFLNTQNLIKIRINKQLNSFSHLYSLNYSITCYINNSSNNNNQRINSMIFNNNILNKI